MRKKLFGLLLLSLAACKKNNETELYPIYMVKVTCANCVIGIVGYPTVKIDVKGTAELPYTYIPENIEFTIWSNVPNDKAMVTFNGKNYAAFELYSGVLKVNSEECDLVNKQLPPTR
jgi:hypothetical protein